MNVIRFELADAVKLMARALMSDDASYSEYLDLSFPLAGLWYHYPGHLLNNFEIGNDCEKLCGTKLKCQNSELLATPRGRIVIM